VDNFCPRAKIGFFDPFIKKGGGLGEGWITFFGYQKKPLIFKGERKERVKNISVNSSLLFGYG